MENTTIIRRIDDLGRIVLPVDVRRTMNIMPGDTLEMIYTNDYIKIKKYASIQNIMWLAKVISNSLYDIYRLDTSLEDSDHPLSNSPKKDFDKYIVPIFLENHQIGNFVVYNYKEEYKKIIDFVVLIFNKYLEEQG